MEPWTIESRKFIHSTDGDKLTFKRSFKSKT